MSLPKLPSLLDRKIYKTGQTRGADDDVIFQNRVGRNSTVLIPFQYFNEGLNLQSAKEKFENGFIVLISPSVYFDNPHTDEQLTKRGLVLGKNVLIFYETRDQWVKYNPEKLKWRPAESRTAPLRGKYVARVPATTSSDNGGKIIRGFTNTTNKGAGIRIYEYASKKTIDLCRIQLEAIFWHCRDSIENISAHWMSPKSAQIRRDEIISLATKEGLLDYEKLIKARILANNKKTICPLCLDELSSAGFLNRITQALGREVPDLTVTEINLFHISELRQGAYNHRPYNVGWGHHHCNVVTKDSGIDNTIIWMTQVIKRNVEGGFVKY